MAAIPIIAICCAAILHVAYSAVNTEVLRTIDLTSAIVKMTIELKISNIEKEYKIAFPDSQAEKLSFIAVYKKGKQLPLTAPVS